MDRETRLELELDGNRAEDPPVSFDIYPFGTDPYPESLLRSIHDEEVEVFREKSGS